MDIESNQGHWGRKQHRGHKEAASILLLGEPDLLPHCPVWVTVADSLCVHTWAAPLPTAVVGYAHPRGFMATTQECLLIDSWQ